MKIYAVLMAGGRGTRFWPLSRANRPKQLLRLIGQETMLQATVSRIKPLIPLENIFVVVGPEIGGEVRKQLPDLPDENIVVEPQARNTGPCIGLAALHVQQRDPAGIMVVLPADHVIGDEAAFRVMVQIGARLAGSGSHLVTLGVAPTRPETGYGHIQVGQQMGEIDGHPFYRVQAFIEKPDWPRAKTYTESGQYLWNSGMFIWSVETVLESLRRHLPDLHGGLMSIAATPGKQQRRQKIESVYRSMDSISIDYGVMEKADNVIVVPCHFGWNDVGTWASLGDIQQADAHGNVVLCPFVGLETTNSIIVAQQKLVATIGLDDLIIVDTPDALLICPRERAQAVKEIVERLHAEGLDAYS